MSDADTELVGCRKCRRYCSLYFRIFILILVPTVLSPIIILNYTLSFQCIYIVCVMAIYWVTEVIPMQITAMIPIVAFPFFGILSSNDVCMTYFGSSTVMFMGGIMLAIAIESSKLHIRIALKTTQCIGVNFKRLHLSILLITAFISMWISNMATASMVCPIVSAILEELQANNLYDMYVDKKTDEPDRVPTPVTKAFLIGVAYAASIGGSASLIGTSANMVILGMYETRFPNNIVTLDFLNFLSYTFLPMIILLFLTIIILQIIYLGLFRSTATKSKTKLTKEAEQEIRVILNLKLKELGSLSMHEFQTLVLFVIAIALCCTKTMGSYGWDRILNPEDPKFIKNAATFILFVLIMFVLPKSFECCNFCMRNKPLPTEPTKSILDWAYVNKKFPWHLIFLMGGGFAIAKGLKESGASAWLGQNMVVVKDRAPITAVVSMFAFTIFFTNFTSNVAVANIVLPILVEMALSLKVHPLYFMVPCGVACSFAFLLPVGTPPNALVALFANIPTKDFLFCGIFPTAIAIATFPGLFPIWGRVIFPRIFDYVPEKNTTDVRF